MFEFIKRFLSEEEKPLKTLTLQELEQWLGEQTKEKESKFLDFAKKQQEDIVFLSNQLKEQLETLEKAQLQNKNIPTRAVSFMQGNRESYIRTVNRFLQELPDFRVPSAQEVESHLAHFKTLLEHHSKASAKNYQILQQFFANETQVIAKQVAKINHTTKSIEKKMSSLGLDQLVEIQKQVHQLQEKINHQNQLKQHIQTQKEQREGITNKKQEIRNSLDEFLKTEQFLQHKKHQEKKQDLEKQLKEKKNILIQEFSSLERALKKLAKIAVENEELIIEYVYRPEETMKKDTSLVILDILKQLERSIQAGGIVLDEKKKQKALNAIQKLDKPFFEKHLGSLLHLSREIEIVHHHITTSDVVRKHQEILEELDKVEDEIQRLTRSLEETQEKHNKIDLDKMKQNIQTLTYETLKQPISISM